jgi:DNA-binding transcriptional regulator YhcF (GntR family)
VIVFRLDTRSKVATYMQLVQQVRQALRTGVLEAGDQLPKVRDVAESLAINPNTVLKAYRELELEGLVVGRPGVGTFVLRSLAGPSLASQAGLRRELVAWLRRARVAGLEQEDVVAVVETTMRDAFEDVPVGREGAA